MDDIGDRSFAFREDGHRENPGLRDGLFPVRIKTVFNC
jgi:hypothetical protein